MSRHEGPRTAFEFIVRRFREPPCVIIYDNACNLSRYCLKREPVFFADTLFLIDRVHSPGHVGCPETMHLRSFPDSRELAPGVTVGQLNSQVAEQMNSRLETIATQVAFMNHGNFVDHVKLFLYRKNEAIRTKMASS
jgi:hypothetical protein